MNVNCSQCSAGFPPGETCRDRFDLCLAKEFEHPDTYGAVHYFTVACYMLQHNEYSRQAWLDTRAGLAQVLRQGLTPAALRKQNRQKLDSSQRKWKVTRGERIPEVDAIDWTRTIADVRLDSPEVYCADVKQWANSLLSDTDALVQELGAA